MRPSYLGKILLRWCDQCHTPVLAQTCACGEKTREVPVTPPGDARPAFPADIALINRIYNDHFGAPLILPGHLVLLNKVPDHDRMEEIIVGGGIAGIIRYFPDQRCWEPIPRPEACTLFTPKKRYVVVDEGAVPFIKDQGMSVLAPGLDFIDDDVCAGDEVFILAKDGTCVGVGRAKTDAAIARGMEKGSIVRTRRNISSLIVPGAARWETAVASNSDVLERAESSAIGFVREVTGQNPHLVTNISYSGGKDSLATLLVVIKAIGKVPMLFADTGMEFPETYANVEEASRHYGLDIIRTDGKTTFWETFDRQGPPAVNARWCCRVCKLTPVANLIREQWGECLSFIGQRRYESAARAQSKRVWRNSNVRAQLSAAPIQNWTALHVWLYLMREHAPYNILYERHLDRIGCFMCPSSDMALIHLIEAEYPDLWESWRSRLEQWQEARGLSADWVTGGKWRLLEGCTDDEDSHY
ncbi:MAG: phosphoadenosine phosphosulfate reductase family protein [Methanoregula sp.]|jgi:phosphoadenosine phosphosulfate reductase|nr:phosphoadenosine phosphosulfate reductase family protein [Methanoregula sp.]